MITTTIHKSCIALVDILKERGIRNVVLSPGSRNAPLITVFSRDDFFDKKIIIDADYVGEYKVYLIPKAVNEHVNANVWDRGRADDSILTYAVDYNELHNMCFYALQQITKEQEKEIAQLKESIEELKGMITNA